MSNDSSDTFNPEVPSSEHLTTTPLSPARSASRVRDKSHGCPDTVDPTSATKMGLTVKYLTIVIS